MTWLKRHWLLTVLIAIPAYLFYKYKKQGGISILGTTYMAPLDLTK